MTQDEKAIRGVLTEFVTAIRNKDATAMIASLADDEVTFDLAPPLRMAPAQTHDASRLEQWFSTWQGPIRSEPNELTVAVGGDIAYAYGIQHLTGTQGGEDVDLWFRATACFRRDDGRWCITHMHNSVPFAMDGSDRALLDLKP